MRKQGDLDIKQRKSRAGLSDVEIIEMYNNGKSCEDIAGILGVSDTSIIYRLKKIGLYKGRRGYLKIILNKIDDLENEIFKNKISTSDTELIVNRLKSIIEKLDNKEEIDGN